MICLVIICPQPVALADARAWPSLLRAQGPLPSQLGLLTNLKTLYIANNAELDGSIPSQLAQLGSLKVMNLGSNALTGAVPSEIFSMNSLETLCALHHPRPSCVHCCKHA